MLSPRYEAALRYAFACHADQFRKESSIPYMSHVLAVSSLVMEHGGDEDEAIAGLLHDVIEDAGGDARRDELRGQFGPRVLAIVEGCTDTDLVPKPPWRPRKEAYLERLKTASPSVARVAACDKLHNARSILLDVQEQGETVFARFKGGRDGTLWYYTQAEHILVPRVPPRLGRQLRETVQRLVQAAG